jgi:hypothetical protein
MVLIPFEKIVYETKLPINTVLDRLHSIIEPEQNYFYDTTIREYVKSFRGKLSNKSFKIVRNINYRNSALPIIKGKIIQENEKVTVIVFIRTNLFTIIFMQFWTFIHLFMILVTSLYFLMVIFPIFIFGIVLNLHGYNIESKKAKEIFSEVLEIDKKNDKPNKVLDFIAKSLDDFY